MGQSIAFKSVEGETPLELMPIHSENDEWTNVSISGEICNYNHDDPQIFVENVMKCIASKEENDRDRGKWSCEAEISCPDHDMCEHCFSRMNILISSWE